MDIDKLMKMREGALEYKHLIKAQKLEKQFHKKGLSKRTYDSKKINLDQWMERERKILLKD